MAVAAASAAKVFGRRWRHQFASALVGEYLFEQDLDRFSRMQSARDPFGSNMNFTLGKADLMFSAGSDGCAARVNLDPERASSVLG